MLLVSSRLLQLSPLAAAHQEIVLHQFGQAFQQGLQGGHVSNVTLHAPLSAACHEQDAGQQKLRLVAAHWSYSADCAFDLPVIHQSKLCILRGETESWGDAVSGWYFQCLKCRPPLGGQHNCAFGPGIPGALQTQAGV